MGLGASKRPRSLEFESPNHVIGDTPCSPSDIRSAARAALPAASQNRRFDLSPIDALIDIKVQCRLRRKIPVRLCKGSLALDR